MLEDAAQTSLRDDIAAAAETVEDVSRETIEASESPGQPRDEIGRFARKEQEPQPAPVQEAAPQAAPERTRPKSWKREYWEKFDALDPEVAKYILEREEQYTTGVGQYRAQVEALKPLYEAVAPYQQHIAQYGIQPQDAVRQLLGTHLTLLNASPEQKLGHFRELAAFYGVPLQALQGQNARIDPVTNRLWQEVQQLRGQWQQYRSLTEQQQAAQAISTVESFGKGKEFFEDVRGLMADLLDSGMARSLEDAYDKALRLNDDVWRKAQAGQSGLEAKKQAAERSAAAARAKASAVSPRSSSPTGSANGSARDNSIRSLLESSVEQVMGRV